MKIINYYLIAQHTDVWSETVTVDWHPSTILCSVKVFNNICVFLDTFSQGEPRVLGLAMIPGHHVVSIEVEADSMEDAQGFGLKHWHLITQTLSCGQAQKENGHLWTSPPQMLTKNSCVSILDLAVFCTLEETSVLLLYQKWQLRQEVPGFVSKHVLIF